MKTLVTYQSKTGFTKKYAEWIAQALNCDLKEAAGVNAALVADYDIVIHGGWIMGGMVSGLDKIRNLKPRNLLVFGVGFTTKEEMELLKCKEANHLSDIPFFYYEGGTNPKKMGFMGKFMVKMVTKRTPVYTDNTNKGEIAELVKLVQSLY